MSEIFFVFNPDRRSLNDWRGKVQHDIISTCVILYVFSSWIIKNSFSKWKMCAEPQGVKSGNFSNNWSIETVYNYFNHNKDIHYTWNIHLQWSIVSPWGRNTYIYVLSDFTSFDYTITLQFTFPSPCLTLLLTSFPSLLKFSLLTRSVS